MKLTNMKRLKVTDKVKANLAAALGSEDFDAERYAVFETVAINTLPLSKKGSVFDGGRLTMKTLQAMHDHIAKEKFVPLHTLHRAGSELPVGRVMAAMLNKTTDSNGKEVDELRAQFYVPLSNDDGRRIADGLDTGIINEVSVGIRAATMKCSSCDFDYMGPKASFMNFMDLTCDNEHTIGKDGVHVVLDGLDKFHELSLVSRGAADHATIQSPHTAITASSNDNVPEYQILYATKGSEKETVMKLTPEQIAELKAALEKDGKAALEAKFSGVVEAMTMLKADMTMDDAKALRQLMKDEVAKFDAAQTAKPDPKLEAADVSELKADLIVAGRDIKSLNATIVAKDETIATLTTENAQLKNNKVQLDALTSEVTPVKDFLKVVCQNLLVASGVSNPTIPESLSELVASIKVAQSKLTKLPTGGLLLTAETGSTTTTDKTGAKDMSSFKTVK